MGDIFIVRRISHFIPRAYATRLSLHQYIISYHQTLRSCSAYACLTLPMWEEYYRMTHKFFYEKKLSYLLDSRDPVYYI